MCLHRRSRSLAAAWRLSLTTAVAAAACLVGSAPAAYAQVIRSPIAVLENTAGDFNSDADIGNIIDRSGLLPPFVSGITDFDTYIAGNPVHNFAFIDNEWFSPDGATSTTIVLDMGSVFTIDRLALWNEDILGIGEFLVQTSNDPTFASSTTVGGLFLPNNNPSNANYPAQVFTLTSSDARYVRLLVAAVTDTNGGMAIGEVAFRTSATTSAAAPEPGTAALAVPGLALPLLGALLARRRRQ